MVYEITIGGKNKNKSRKELQLENLKWKLRFHQEQAEKTLQQIKDLEARK